MMGLGGGSAIGKRRGAAAMGRSIDWGRKRRPGLGVLFSI
jgi:hypothetical protein